MTQIILLINSFFKNCLIRTIKNCIQHTLDFQPQHKVPKLVNTSEKQQNSVSSKSSSETPNVVGSLNEDEEDQFEIELYWCIRQLQAGLSEEKLHEKQVYNMTKSLNVLKSSNSSFIKKRQVMRNTFGDYRSKMIEEEKKFSRKANVAKFVPVNKKLEKKSVSLRKARFHTDPNINNTDALIEQFKFNFSIDES